MFPFDTVDTTRIPTDSAIEMSVFVSRMQWPTKDMQKLPKTIILIPTEAFPYAFVASSLVHDPIMGNLLFSRLDELAEITCEEITRLNPPGTKSLPPVITVGPFQENVIDEIKNMGYEVLSIMGKSIYSTAAEIARLREQISPESQDGPISLFIISVDIPFEGIVATYYSTHSGVPILLTHRNRLPQATANVLQEMEDKHVYIIGSKFSVSNAVADEITSIIKSPVKRIAGDDPFETSVKFSQYYDPLTHLGWNRNKKGLGDAFTFGNVSCWALLVAASAFAHQGKHTPLLLVEKNCVSPMILDYINSIKPTLRMPPMPPFMHGFILGSTDTVKLNIQAEIETALKIDEQ